MGAISMKGTIQLPSMEGYFDPSVRFDSMTQTVLAPNRTCKQAHIPPEFCPRWSRTTATPCGIEPSRAVFLRELALNRSIELMNSIVEQRHVRQQGKPNCQRFRPHDFRVDFASCDVAYEATDSSAAEYSIDLHFSSQDPAHKDPAGEALSYSAVMRTRDLKLSKVSAFRVHRTSANEA